MLPAISSDLPAYLLPQKVGEGGRQTHESAFGPAFRVDLSTDRAVTEASASPGNGLYGPNGQFVEASVDVRSARQAPARSEPAAPAVAEQAEPVVAVAEEVEPAVVDAEEVEPAGENVAGTHPVTVEDVSLSPDQPRMLATGGSEDERELSLSDFESVVPPAARTELRELADNVGRLTDSDRLGPRELKQIADLMSRVGRHDYAKRALDRAAELENTAAPQQGERPAVLQVAESVGAASLAGLEE